MEENAKVLARETRCERGLRRTIIVDELKTQMMSTDVLT